MKLFQSPSKPLRYHVSFVCFNHAKGAACVNHENLRHVLIEQELLSLFVCFQLKVAIVCEGVASDGHSLLLFLDFVNYIFREESLVQMELVVLIRGTV